MDQHHIESSLLNRERLGSQTRHRITCDPKAAGLYSCGEAGTFHLAAAEDHIQVLGEIQPGRKQLDQGQPLCIKLGLLNEKARKGQCARQGTRSTKLLW